MPLLHAERHAYLDATRRSMREDAPLQNQLGERNCSRWAGIERRCGNCDLRRRRNNGLAKINPIQRESFGSEAFCDCRRQRSQNFAARRIARFLLFRGRRLLRVKRTLVGRRLFFPGHHAKETMIRNRKPRANREHRGKYRRELWCASHELLSSPMPVNVQPFPRQKRKTCSILN
jgi:hypothetical protein